MKKTNRMVNVYRIGLRRIYEDAIGQLWVKVQGKWYKFPQQIDY